MDNVKRKKNSKFIFGVSPTVHFLLRSFVDGKYCLQYDAQCSRCIYCNQKKKKTGNRQCQTQKLRKAAQTTCEHYQMMKIRVYAEHYLKKKFQRKNATENCESSEKKQSQVLPLPNAAVH